MKSIIAISFAAAANAITFVELGMPAVFLLDNDMLI
jgi:hypothetical protein